MAKRPAKAKQARKTKSQAAKKKAPAAKASQPAAGPSLGRRILNVPRDATDLRDRHYEPALLGLELSMNPPGPDLSPIRDQGGEGSCTGFALSSAITFLNRKRHSQLSDPVEAPLASARMLYEMAKLNDEWPGEDYEGSSIRAALKGFFNNGVCSEDLAPYVEGERNWYLNKDQAEDARKLGLGAYFRLRPQIIDYHAALNEAGVIYASAMVHRGWQRPRRGDIAPSNVTEGGHAFIIVGYDDKGFLIQNSWGEEWGGFNGQPGIARWRYEDWSANIMDAWVLRLNVPTPDSFDLTVRSQEDASRSLLGSPTTRAPRHEEIVGHIIHLDDGDLVETGKYPTPVASLQETANFLADENATAGRDYRHLLFYAHGGLNDQNASANRVRKMKEVFKRNGIYPIHFMWETGFFETLGDIIFASNAKAAARVGSVSDIFDRVLETTARLPGRAIWRDMKRDAGQSFLSSGGGTKALKILLKGNAKRQKPLKIHLIGHSAGGIFLGHLLDRLNAVNPLSEPVQSCSLMAPACTIDFFNRFYHPRIGGKNAASDVAQLVQYNLIDQRERDDSVGPYRKSLLYLVSNAFEDTRKMPLLGMENFSKDLSLKPAHKLHYAGRGDTITDSKTHGGFDNDRATMNNILKNILGVKPSPAKGFQPEDMTGY